MNKIYKVIWNKARNCYMAVAEFVKRQGKSSSGLNRRHIGAALGNKTAASLLAGKAVAAALLAASVVCGVPGMAMANSGGTPDADGNYIGNAPDYAVVIDSDVRGEVYGCRESDLSALRASVMVKSGTVGIVGAGTFVYGGFSVSGYYVSSNMVTVSGGTVGVSGHGEMIGGRSMYRNAEDNTVTVSSGTLNVSVGGGYSGGEGDAKINTVIISGGTVQEVYGGRSESGSATGNEVTVSGGSVTGNVYGGRSVSGSATGNDVTVSGGSVRYVYGGYSDSGNTDYNTVEISGGTVQNVYGGYSYSGAVTDNSVEISGGMVSDYVYGGYSDNGAANGNSVEMSGGTVYSVHGGRSKYGSSASSNTVRISDGSVSYVYGGYSDSSAANGNSVDISGGTVSSDVYGGYTLGGSSESSASGNTVRISGGTVEGTVDGGFAFNGDAVNNTIILSKEEGKAVPILKGTLSGGSAFNDGGTVSANTLQVEAAGLSAPEIRKFENYKFVLPSDIEAGDTMLTLTRQDKNLTVDGSKVGITTDGRQNGLYLDESITLLEKTDGSGSFTVDNPQQLPQLEDKLDGDDSGFTTLVGKALKPDGEDRLNFTVTEKYLYGEGVENPVKGERHTGNTLNITDGVKATAAFGGRATNGDVTGNKVTMTGGEIVLLADSANPNYGVSGNVYGGLVEAGNATGNEVTVSGGTVRGSAYGGYTNRTYMKAARNKVTITGGEVGDVYGGRVEDFDEIGSHLSYSIEPASAIENTVEIRGGIVNGDVYGGHSELGPAERNTVILAKEGKDAPSINGTLYGGYSSGGGRVSGNTLQVEAAGLTAPEIRNFENYKFVLPEDIKAGDTMLTLSRQDKNLTVDGSKVGITTDGRQNGLYLDESITLLEGPEGGFVEGGHYEFLINNYDKLPTLTQRLDDEATGFTTMVAKTEPVRGENKIRLTVSEKYLYGEGVENPVKGERHTGNTLNITDGVKATAAFGGRATNGDVTGNKVTMTGGEIVSGSSSGSYAGNLYGGLAENGNAAGNEVTVSGGTLGRFTYVYGGRSEQGAAGGTDPKDGNKVTITGGTVGAVQGGYSLGDASYNSVEIAGGTVQGNAYGGESTQGNALNNSVTVKEGTAGGVFGGYTYLTGKKAAGNKVTITGGTVWDVYGGWVDDTNEMGDSVSGSPNPASATENTVEIRGGTVKYDVYGGRSMLGPAERNTVILAKEGKEAPVINGTLYGGVGGSVKNNTLQVEAVGLSAPQIMNFDNYKFVLPSDIKAGDTMLKLTEQVGGLTIDGNKVSVTFHELNLKHGESVSLLSVESGQTISGSNLGRLWEQPFQDASPDNSVVLRGTESYRLSVDAAKTRLNYEIDHIAVDTVQLGATDWQKNAVLLHGTSDAYLYDKVTVLDTAKFAMRFAKPETVAVGDSMTLLAANNTLRDMAAETKQNAYQFTPVAGVTVDAAIRGSLAAKSGNVTYTVDENRAGKLTFGNVQWKDSGALLKRPGNITFAGAEVDTQKIHFTNVEQLKANQKMTLVSDFGNSVGTITGDHYTVGTTLHGKGKASLQGSDLVYTVETGTHTHDPEPVPEAQPQTHNVLMAMTAGMQMVKQGGDFMNKAASGLGASENTDADGGSVFAAVGGGAGRTETGSHVKTHTWNGIVAVGASRKIESGTFQWGVFGEYGKGNYSLHNDTGRGDGDVHYAGGGLLAKWTNKHDVYTEVGVRLGRMSDKASDLLEDADGNRYGYDIHTNYYGAHLGFGKVFRYKGGRSLDVYGKYFYTKRDGADFEAGGHYSLDSVKSSVLRVGARYGTSDKRWNWYGGLAYEYEFDGKSTGTADGRPIRAASIKGGSVRGEVGLRMEATQKNPWQADISLTGYAGRHRGFGGNVSVAYTF